MTNRSELVYPLEPLAQAMGMRVDNKMLLLLRVSGSDYQRYRDVGMSRYVADRLAVRAGFHPYEIWPEMIVEDFDAGDVRDAEIAEWYERKLQKNRERARRRRARKMAVA